VAELEKIKDRVRKLLALSKSNNENEAAAALGKANEIIREYDLDEKDLQFTRVAVKATKLCVPWRTAISNAAGWLYGCYKYHDPETGEFVFTGDPLYVFMAGEMYDYLTKTVERTAKKQIRKNAKSKFRRDFKYGMANRLFDRIYALGELCSWAPQRERMRKSAKEMVKKEIVLTTRPDTPRSRGLPVKPQPKRCRENYFIDL
jgi:hypothetical protein